MADRKEIVNLLKLTKINAQSCQDGITSQRNEVIESIIGLGRETKQEVCRNFERPDDRIRLVDAEGARVCTEIDSKAAKVYDALGAIVNRCDEMLEDVGASATDDSHPDFEEAVPAAEEAPEPKRKARAKKAS